MTDHPTDLTPPPDEPLSDQARARIRAGLLEAAESDHSRGAQRWLVPAVAAAAVLAVVGLAGWAVQAGGDGESDAPAGDGTSVPSDPPVDSPEPSETLDASKVPGTQEDHQVDVKELGCARTMRNTLAGAEQVAAFPDGGGHHTTIWVAGDRFTVCDVAVGQTTTHQPLPLTPANRLDTFRVSSTYLPNDGGFDVTLLAGGVVPDGAMAYGVTYTFPDGRSAQAEVTTGSDGRKYWRVLHSYADDGGNQRADPPIEVTLSLSGVRRTYELQWGLDTCAQANHGC